MSQANIEKFYEALSKDAKMLEDFKALIVTIKDDKSLADQLPAFAAERGFDFTFEEFKALQEQKKTQIQQLDDKQLDDINAAGVAICYILGIGSSITDKWEKITCEGKGGCGCCKYVGIGLGGFADSKEDDRNWRFF